MEPIPFGIVGALGRMGRSIVSICLSEPDCPLRPALAVVSQNTSGIGQDLGELLGHGSAGVLCQSGLDGLSNVRVVIDFSTAENSGIVSEQCMRAGVPLLTGTTALSEEQMAVLRRASETIPVMVAPNLSVGINLLYNLLSQVVTALPDFDIEITETHHREKKDAPSGTAHLLKDALLEAKSLQPEQVIYGREGLLGRRPENQIGIHTLRGGDVAGEHTIHFLGLGERIELTHRATSREPFARGALKAAAFLSEASPGSYSMRDVLWR